MQCASNTKKFKDCLFSLCYKTPQLNTSVLHVLQKNALFLFIEMMFYLFLFHCVPRAPVREGLVACLPVRLFFKSTKHNAFYPV